MPRTWARQWMHFSEGTPFFKPSLMSQFTVGTNILVISLHPSSTVFLTACIRYTRISDLSSALYTNQDTRELHRLSESFSSNDSENRTTQHKTVPLKQNKTCWKLFSTRLPEIPRAHWKSKILTLYLHHPREACVISAPLQQASLHSFPNTNFTFHKLFLRNTHFSLPATKEAWVTLSSRQTLWYHQQFNAVTLPLKLKAKKKKNLCMEYSYSERTKRVLPHYK